MNTPELTLEQRLTLDIEHLREELANNELALAHATGTELRYREELRRELQETIDSKAYRLKGATVATELRSRIEGSFSKLLTALVLVLLLAGCAKRFTPAGSHGEYPAPRVVQKGGPSNV